VLGSELIRVSMLLKVSKPAGSSNSLGVSVKPIEFYIIQINFEIIDHTTYLDPLNIGNSNTKKSPNHNHYNKDLKFNSIHRLLNKFKLHRTTVVNIKMLSVRNIFLALCCM
jgi:hypothetical protein